MAGPVAPTTTDIWNIAFTRLGLSTVSSTSDNKPHAQAASNVWDFFRYQFISDHSWNGAKTTIELTADSTAPEDRWDYRYKLNEDDLIRVLRLNGEENRPGTDIWEEEIDSNKDYRYILTDASSAKVEILEDITSETTLGRLLGPHVAHAMAINFAALLAPRLAKSEGEVRSIREEAGLALAKAKAIDSMTGTPQRWGDSTLVDVRA